MKNSEKYGRIIDACVGAIEKRGPQTARQLLAHVGDRIPRQHLTASQLAGIIRTHGNSRIYGERSAHATNWEHGGCNNIYYTR